MIFHTLFNRHRADLKASRWQGGYFVTDCLVCGRTMVKPPGETWQLARVSPPHGDHD